MERIIEETADGTATIFLPTLNEHYHSTKGARTESQHVFVDMGMKHSPALAPRILEIGFGTGLNALLTLQAGEQLHKQIHYTGIELHPLPWATVAQLNYSHTPQFRALHESLWNTDVSITPRFTLHKIQGDFTTYHFTGTYDVVYFDAFSPEKQPEMWTPQLIAHLYRIMPPAGIVTTYCAKGAIRRLFQDTGFAVERLPGPPSGKREILRATKN
jgi:tRNA U34 5-methylaminomethyl-2-thiouridine-forming methyltransferase MnmC